MKKRITIIICLFISTITIAQNKGLLNTLNDEKNRIESCYSKLQNDTLIIGNKFIERRFKWNKGNIISIDISNKKSEKKYKSKTERIRISVLIV